jgi:ribosomal subunit interface protein
MNLSVKGKNIAVGESLRDHIAKRLEGVFDKYFGDAIEAGIALAKEAHFFSVQVSVHVGRGILLQSQATAPEAYAAFDAALDHLAKRLRRYKRRLRDHRRGDEKGLKAAQYVLAPESEEETERPSPASPVAEPGPAIVAEMEAEIPSLSVADAVMRMDLADQPVLLFLNSAHGGLNLVYRRDDGNIGWIDPRLRAGSPA